MMAEHWIRGRGPEGGRHRYLGGTTGPRSARIPGLGAMAPKLWVSDPGQVPKAFPGMEALERRDRTLGGLATSSPASAFLLLREFGVGVREQGLPHLARLVVGMLSQQGFEPRLGFCPLAQSRSHDATQ